MYQESDTLLLYSSAVHGTGVSNARHALHVYQLKTRKGRRVHTYGVRTKGSGDLVHDGQTGTKAGLLLNHVCNLNLVGNVHAFEVLRGALESDEIWLKTPRLSAAGPGPRMKVPRAVWVWVWVWVIGLGRLGRRRLGPLASAHHTKHEYFPKSY